MDAFRRRAHHADGMNRPGRWHRGLGRRARMAVGSGVRLHPICVMRRRMPRHSVPRDTGVTGQTERKAVGMNSFWDFLVWLFWFYVIIACIWIFITVFIDIFRDSTLNGWGKALWVHVPGVRALPRRVHLPDRPRPRDGGAERRDGRPRRRPRAPTTSARWRARRRRRRRPRSRRASNSSTPARSRRPSSTPSRPRRCRAPRPPTTGEGEP